MFEGRPYELSLRMAAALHVAGVIRLLFEMRSADCGPSINIVSKQDVHLGQPCSFKRRIVVMS